MQVAEYLYKKGCNKDETSYTGQTILGLLISKKNLNAALEFNKRFGFKNMNHSEKT